MLANELTDLLKYDVRDVLKTPSLLMTMLRLYSKIFLNDQPCSTCEKKHESYYQRLSREGAQMITKLNTMEATKTKYKFKNEGTLIQTPFGDYLQSTITDSDVELICEHSPRFRNQFINPPDLIEDIKADITPDDLMSEDIETKPFEPVKQTRKPRTKKTR